ncbi:Glycine--tRNA ligase 1, mitochondrial [Coemansia sp. BCRC 34301]|nr:Glycine--tRNA ligase 1, mitochondrial [Coemansia sp. BCRC 34301]
MTDSNLNIDRSALESVVLNRFFYVQSFSIYNGVAGLYDFGPTGAALQQNLISLWRQHFVIEEDMLEVDCSIMTPAEVLKVSGHVEKFADWMCKDTVDGSVIRADHLVEAVLEARLQGGNKPAAELEEYKFILAQIDNYDGQGLAELITKFDIRNPDTGNAVTTPAMFNLMFESSIGPSGNLKGYLRPETAQGQFVNFSRLLDFNNQKMPFASAMVGRSFRNEIAPRQGLLRVREFTMAEVEHYVDPNNKDHPRFDEVAHVKLPLLPSQTQLDGKTAPIMMSIGEAVAAGTVDNKTLGYFLARIYLYLMAVGIKHDLLRFRQHLPNEMAHYATDCWDAEIKTSHGWVECVGCADRSAYDLSKHSAYTKEKLCVRENLPTPLVTEKLVCEANNKVFGPRLKRAANPVKEYLYSLSEAELTAVQSALSKDGKTTVVLSGTPADGEYEITSDMVLIEKRTIVEHVREYTPNVIEPSFGVGRILYSLLEHSFNVREGAEQRSYFSFNPAVAPFKCLILPLSGHASFAKPVQDVARRLRACGVPARVDDSTSASIGRRYSRNDELGTPFAITVDFQTANDGTVTLRERDTTRQIRASIDEIVELVKSIVSGSISWDDVLSKHPLIDAPTSDGTA